MGSRTKCSRPESRPDSFPGGVGHSPEISSNPNVKFEINFLDISVNFRAL